MIARIARAFARCRVSPIVSEMAKDPTLAGYDPTQADVLVVPANGRRPAPGGGEAIEEGYVPGLLPEEDDFHLGN